MQRILHGVKKIIHTFHRSRTRKLRLQYNKEYKSIEENYNNRDDQLTNRQKFDKFNNWFDNEISPFENTKTVVRNTSKAKPFSETNSPREVLASPSPKRKKIISTFILTPNSFIEDIFSMTRHLEDCKLL